MPACPPLRRSPVPELTAAVRVLRQLSWRKRYDALGLPSVLISSPHPEPIVTWVANSGARASRRHPQRTKRDSRWAVSGSQRQRFVQDLLQSIPKPEKPHLHEAETGIVILHRDRAHVDSMPGSATVIPLDLSTVAECIRARTAWRLETSHDGAGGSAEPERLLLEGCKMGHAVETVNLLCSPHSKDLVITELDTPRSCARSQLADTLTVGASVLRSSGSLLIVSQAPITLPSHAHQFARWHFADVLFGCTREQDVSYLLCTSTATQHAVRHVDVADFPGFLPKGAKRKKQWNPYKRETEDKFFASLRPAFTNAQLTGEALQAHLERERQDADQFAEADAAFFDLSHAMVTGGQINDKRDN